MRNRKIVDVISEMDKSISLNQAAAFLVKYFCEIYEWSYGEVWLPSEDERFMKWSGYWAKNKSYFKNFSKFSSIHKFGKGIGLIGRVWHEKKSLWIEDIFTDNNFLRIEVAVKSGLIAAVCIPVINNEKVLCVLCFFMSKLTDEDKTKAGEIFNHSTEIGKALSKFF